MKLPVVITASLMMIGYCVSAAAGKDVFERTKPHINVGTTGYVHAAKNPRDDSKLLQFKIQMGTSDLTSAEQTRSKRKKRQKLKLSQDQ